MLGRNVTAKLGKITFENNANYSAWKFLDVTEKSSKKRNDFTQLWPQRLCLLKVKIHLTFVRI